MRILALGALLLAMGGCATAGEEEMEQRDATLRALGHAMMQFGNQMTEAERQRQWQQSMRRPIMCQNFGGTLSCTAY